MKKIFLLTAAVAALGVTSCDIDDVENITELSTSVFPATEADAEAVLAGVYQNLNTTHANPQMSYLYYACLASDDQLGGGGTNDKLMQAEDLICNYNADMTNQFYADRYAGIARANVLLNILGNPAQNDQVKREAKGEALALRAFYYYELASMYGNVPMVISAEQEDQNQGTIENVWGQILQDYRDAIRIMQPTKKDNGHLDKYAVEGLFARAWLFYTGMYGNGSDISALTSKTYNPLASVNLPDGSTLAKDSVVDCITDAFKSGYDLVPDFRNLWAYTNSKTVNDYEYTKNAKDENGNPIQFKWVEDDNAINPESMFAIKFNKQASWSTTIGYANGIALHFGVRGGQDVANTFPFGQGWGAGPVATNLVTDWVKAEPNDMRRQATVEDWSASTTYAKGGWADFVQETDYYSKKWSPVCAKNDGSVPSLKTDETPYVFCFETLMYPGNWDISGENNFQLSNIHDLVLLRYADVCLMYAELTGDVEGINKVRRRAHLEEIKAYSLEALQNERRWELACEGIRWNDIRRWHIAADALDKQTNVKVYYCGAEGKNEPHNGGYVSRYNATAGFMKMPETQIALGTVKQNPGWEDASSEYTGW